MILMMHTAAHMYTAAIITVPVFPNPIISYTVVLKAVHMIHVKQFHTHIVVLLSLPLLTFRPQNAYQPIPRSLANGKLPL